MHAVRVLEADKILRDLDRGVGDGEMPLSHAEFEDADIEHRLLVEGSRPQERTAWVATFGVVDVVESDCDWVIRRLRYSSADHHVHLLARVVVQGDRCFALGEEPVDG